MIEISKAAISEIERMQRGRKRCDSKLRLGFETGGCKNFYYTIELADSVEERDLTYSIEGIAIVIDRQVAGYLDRLKLDYSEDLMGGGFRFQNSQATDVCGCGNSFSLAEPISGSIASSEAERWQLPT